MVSPLAHGLASGSWSRLWFMVSPLVHGLASGSWSLLLVLVHGPAFGAWSRHLSLLEFCEVSRKGRRRGVRLHALRVGVARATPASCWPRASARRVGGHCPRGALDEMMTQAQHVGVYHVQNFA